MLSGTRPTVVTSGFNSKVLPVKPSLSRTSRAILQTVKGLSSGISSSQVVLVSCFFDQFAEFRKQRLGIVGPGRRLGMVLHAINRLFLVPQTLHGLIVQVDAVHRNL